MLSKIRTATYLFPITFILLTFICFGLKVFQGMGYDGSFLTGSIYDLLFNIQRPDPLLMTFVIIDIVSLIFGLIIYAVSFIKGFNKLAKVIDIMALVNASILTINIILSFFLKMSLRSTSSLFINDTIYIPDIFFALAIITYIYSLFVPRIYFRTRLSHYKLFINSYLFISLILDCSIFIILGTNYLDFNLKAFVSMYSVGLMFIGYIFLLALPIITKLYCIISYHIKGDKYAKDSGLAPAFESSGIYLMIPFFLFMYNDVEFKPDITTSNTPLGFAPIMIIVISLASVLMHALVITYIFMSKKFLPQKNKDIEKEYHEDKTLQYNLLANFNIKTIKPRNSMEGDMIGIPYRESSNEEEKSNIQDEPANISKKDKIKRDKALKIAKENKNTIKHIDNMINDISESFKSKLIIIKRKAQKQYDKNINIIKKIDSKNN